MSWRYAPALDWMRDAACVGTDGDMTFGSRSLKARRYRSACRSRCRDAGAPRVSAQAADELELRVDLARHRQRALFQRVDQCLQGRPGLIAGIEDGLGAVRTVLVEPIPDQGARASDVCHQEFEEAITLGLRVPISLCVAHSDRLSNV